MQLDPPARRSPPHCGWPPCEIDLNDFVRKSGANSPRRLKCGREGANKMDAIPAPQISPLMLADRLITLAQDADRAGLQKAARLILRAAERVCEQPPVACGATRRAVHCAG
jgi:hypothetical protein